jgi:hypothetical protein
MVDAGVADGTDDNYHAEGSRTKDAGVAASRRARPTPPHPEFEAQATDPSGSRIGTFGIGTLSEQGSN